MLSNGDEEGWTGGDGDEIDGMGKISVPVQLSNLYCCTVANGQWCISGACSAVTSVSCVEFSQPSVIYRDVTTEKPH